MKKITKKSNPIEISLKTILGEEGEKSSSEATYSFKANGLSRTCVRELLAYGVISLGFDDHYEIANLRCESSFISLDKRSGWMKVNSSFEAYWIDIDRASKYIVLTGDSAVDASSVQALNNLRLRLLDGINNNIAKYCLPESYKTELTLSVNSKELQNLLSVDKNPDASWEIRGLAKAMADVFP